MKKYIYLLLSILVLVLSACGAQKNSTESVPLSPEQEKAAKTFLEMVYTTNYNSRMDKINIEKVEDITDYYSDFASLVDEATLEKMQMNRCPYKYDQLYADDPLSVESITFEVSEFEGQYDFTVKAKNTEKDIEIKGQISVSEDGLINNFTE